MSAVTIAFIAENKVEVAADPDIMALANIFIPKK